jgi:hypothetical protein
MSSTKPGDTGNNDSTDNQLTKTVSDQLKKSGSGGYGSGDTTILTLNDNEIAFLQRVIAAEPTLFDGLVIGSGGTITVSQIPQLVFLVFNIYKQNLISTDVNVDIINVVDFSLTIIIQILAPTESSILIDVLNFCIQLLRTNLPTIEADEQYIAANCCTWTQSFFSELYNGFIQFFSGFSKCWGCCASSCTVSK